MRRPKHRRRPIEPEPWRPGSWEPALLTRFDVTVLTLVVAGMALVRAWDYATPPPWDRASARPSIGLAVVEASAPMWLWVTCLAVPGLLLVASALVRIHIGIWAGHAVLFVVYAALAAGLTVEYITQPWGDGIRSATVLVLPAALHLLLAVRTGWRPHAWIRP